MTDLQAVYEKAADFREKGEDQKAIDLLATILEENPLDEVALETLMDIYFNLDKFKYYITRANLNVAREHYDHAINDLKKALNLDATHAPARFMMAGLYAKENKRLKAIDEYLKVLDFDHSNKMVYMLLSDLYMEEDALDSAIDIVLKGVEAVEDNNELKDGLAKLYLKASDNENAIKYAVDPQLKAKIYLSKDENDKAFEIINKLKKDAFYYSLLAQYYYNISDAKASLEAVENYKNKGGDNVLYYQMKALNLEKTGDKAKSHYYWGMFNKARSNNETSLHEFLQSFQINKHDKETLIELAQMYEKLDEKYTAIEFWEKVYQLDQDSTAKKILGDFYYKQGDYTQSAKYGHPKEGKYADSYEDEGFLNKIFSFFVR